MSQSRPFWDVGFETGRSLTALGFAVALSAAALNVALMDGVGLFYDLVFITLCLVIAWLVRPEDFYFVATLPPVITLVTFALLAAVRPHSIADPGDGFTQALVTGLVHHSLSFLVGFLLCLGCLGLRVRVEAQGGVDA